MFIAFPSPWFYFVLKPVIQKSSLASFSALIFPLFLALMVLFFIIILDIMLLISVCSSEMGAFHNPSVGQGGDWGIKNSPNCGNGQIRIRCVLYKIALHI